MHYFLQWVTADVKYGGGGGGKAWVDKHIHAFVNIAGTLLGVPKAIPALLSGELKDTAAVFVQFAQLLEQYFGRKWRKNLWNTWGSLFGMLPKGGDSIWGVGADVVVGEDNFQQNGTEFRDASNLRNNSDAFSMIKWAEDSKVTCPNSSFNESSWTLHQTLDYIYNYAGGYSDHTYSKIFSHESRKGWKERTGSLDKRKHWHDPVATKLPRASAMKIYCLYGVGVPTERSYYYKVDCEKVESDSACSSSSTDHVNSQICNSPSEEEEAPEGAAVMDTSIYDDAQNLQYGVRFSDGDGSVPLVSLGYMCQKWAEPKSHHNPSGSRVYTRERQHIAEMSISDPGRGGKSTVLIHSLIISTLMASQILITGPLSGEHVDILGNVGVIEDVIRIVTEFEVEEKVDNEIIVSELKEITKRIDSHPLGGLKNVFR